MQSVAGEAVDGGEVLGKPAAEPGGIGLGRPAGIARIHAENVVNFGILPLTIRDEGDEGKLQPGTTIRVSGLHEALRDSTGKLDVQADGHTIR